MNRLTNVNKAIDAMRTATDTGNVVFEALQKSLGDAYGSSTNIAELLGVYVAVLETSGGPLQRALYILGVDEKVADDLVEELIDEYRVMASDRINEAIKESRDDD